MKRITYIITVILLFALSASAQQTRYLNQIYSNYLLTSDIQYGMAPDYQGRSYSLKLDIYSPPASDTASGRPLIIFIHGGGFQSNDKVGSMSTSWLSKFAMRGYVCASINYRLGIDASKSDTAYFKALYRAVQDGKAAVRFFRKNYLLYKIDPGRIYVMGSSAGSKTALHMAYLDDNEIPTFINQTEMGPLEGTSGNPGFSSKVQGVVNCWGAIWDWKWIGKGDVPVYNVHGIADSTVPCDSSYDYHGFKYGGKIVYEAAMKQGVITGWRPFYNTGHTLDNSTVKQDSAFQDINAWLFNIINLSTTGLRGKSSSLPLRNDLGQNFPNPFNSNTIIRYTLNKPGKVTLDIYDIPGQKIATVFEGFQEAGRYQCSFDAAGLPSGTYLYSLITASGAESKKMILMK